MGRQGRQFLAVFRQRHEGRDLPVRAKGKTETERIELPEYTDQIFHGWLPEIGPGQLYGYRVHGPYEPEAGHRFNPNKLLLDPYARAHAGELTWDPAVFGYTIGTPTATYPSMSATARNSCRNASSSIQISTGRASPKRQPVAVGPDGDLRGPCAGLHQAAPEGAEEHRGTYAGLAHKEVIAYIKSLGVTSVEMLPMHSFVNDDYLLDKRLVNYWGYNTIGFFAPDPR